MQTMRIMRPASGSRLRAGILVHVVFVGLLIQGTASCAGPSAREDETTRQGSDERSDADILYEAIADTFSARGIEVATASPTDGIVIGTWAELNSELRRRYVARVFGARGLALRVIAEFQRRDRTGPEPVWVPAEDELTKQRARREEAELGGAIQRAFKSAKRQSD